MNDPVTRDYGGVAILTDLHVFLAQGTVPTATGRSIGNELGFGFYPAANALASWLVIALMRRFSSAMISSISISSTL